MGEEIRAVGQGQAAPSTTRWVGRLEWDWIRDGEASPLAASPLRVVGAELRQKEGEIPVVGAGCLFSAF
jgi:hypothetical protein